jgi:polysaccharide biosynthesis/export protein
MQSIRALVLTFAASSLAACMTLQPPWEEATATTPEKVSAAAPQKQQTAPAPVRNAGKESDGIYRLDTGDRVRVLVAGQDALSNGYEVDAGGAIELPSVGKVNARGLSTVQLSGAIARRLKQGKMHDAHVAVQVETYRPFLIQGDVKNPGLYPYVNNMTTETAIEMAGGLKKRTDKKNVTINNSEREETGSVPARVDAPVKPGDTVTVTEER